MLEIDGGAIEQQIRSDASLVKIPIIFLTAVVARQETKIEIRGFPFLVKPFSMATLVKCIEARTATAS